MEKKRLETLTPQELCGEYRRELNRIYGPKRATKSRVDYEHGRYYVLIAQEYQDGSIGAGGRMPNCYRKSKLIQMLLNLRARKL